MADGEIVINTEIDDKQAQKELDQLTKKIDALNRKIYQDEQARMPLVQQAKELGAALDEANAKLYQMQKAPKGDFSSEQIQTQKETVRALQTQYSEVQRQVEGYDRSLAKTKTTLEQSYTRASELSRYIAGAGESADTLRQRIKEAISTLPAVFASIGRSSVQALSTAIKTLPGLVRRGVSAAGKALKAFGSGALKAAKNLNVFSKSSDAMSGKLKRLESTLKSALVFSVIYKGLDMMKQQLSSYLTVNDELNAALGRLKGALLTAFQPIYDIAIPALTSLVNALASGISAVSQFTATLFGTTAKQAQSNAEALYDQAKATEASGGAAEDATKALASFDEINKLSVNSGGGGGSAEEVSPSIPTFEEDFEDTAFSSWGEAFSAFLDRILGKIPDLKNALQQVANQVNGFSVNLAEMFTYDGIEEKVRTLGSGLANALNGMVRSIDWFMLGTALGSGLNTALTFIVTSLYSFDWITLGLNLASSVNGLLAQIDWANFGSLLAARIAIGLSAIAGFIMGLDMKELAEAASNIVIGFYDKLTETIQSIDWAKIGRQITDFIVNLDMAGAAKAGTDLITTFFDSVTELIQNIDWFSVGETVREFLVNTDWASIVRSVFTAIGTAFGAAASFLWGMIKDAWGEVVGWWYDVAYEDGSFTLSGLLQGIIDKVKGIGTWLRNNVVQPFINGFKSLLGIHSPSTVMAELGRNIMTGLYNGIKNSISTVIGAFRDLWTKVKTWWAQNVAPKFTITFWKEKFSTIGDALKEKIKDAINAAIGLFNTFINWINEKMYFSWGSLELFGKTVIPAGGFQLFTIPQIPYLAQGAVIPPNREFLAVLGDQTSGTNIEAPLSTIKQAIREELAGLGFGGEQTVILQLDRQTLGQVVYTLNKEQTRRIGVNLAGV